MDSMVALMIGIGMGALLAGLVILILIIVGWWTIFEKAGEPGWKAIIPFYNIYILCKIARVDKLFFAFMAVFIVSFFVGNETSLLSSLVNLASFVCYTVLWYNISKAFDHSVGFTIGLVLLLPVFVLILAFGSSEYVYGNSSSDVNNDFTSW